MDENIHRDIHLEPEWRTEARRDFRLRRTGDLTNLLTEREDLRGVHPVADLLDDAVRWSA